MSVPTVPKRVAGLGLPTRLLLRGLAALAIALLGSAGPYLATKPTPYAKSVRPAALVSLRTCNGWFYGIPDANVDLAEVSLGSGNIGLQWAFYLTNAARQKFGSPVTVSMPYAKVNGAGINPPYAPHTEPSDYNFHSSLYAYTIKGQSHPTAHYLRSGNIVQLYWNIASQNGSGDGYALLTCSV